MREIRMSVIRGTLAAHLEQWPEAQRPHDLSVQIFALQPHLHIELEVIFLSIRTYGIVDLELLIVFIHLELAARTSLSLNRGNELCAFVLSNLTIGERRQGRHGEYCYRYDQSHEQVPPMSACSERFTLTGRFSRRVRALRDQLLQLDCQRPANVPQISSEGECYLCPRNEM
jgi:hypothetical protein